MPRRSPDGPVEKVYLAFTPFVGRILDEVCLYEAKRTGKRPNRSMTARKLITMGFAIWKKTKTLPSHER